MSIPKHSVTFVLSAHPGPRQEEDLLRRSFQQDRMRSEYWKYVRGLLDVARPDGRWPKPKVPAFKDLLALLLPSTADMDRAGRSYGEQAIRDEGVRFKALPGVVRLEDLQPAPSLDRLTLPGLPFCPDDSRIMLAELHTLPVDTFTLPSPFPAVLLAQGARRLGKWHDQLQNDFRTWAAASGTLPSDAAAEILRHQVQYGPWCQERPVQVNPVPGIEPARAVLGRQPDRLGRWQWVCWLRFELTPEASAAWFPAARSTDMVGVDPGEVHPLTWAMADTDETLPVCLIDLPDGPERAVTRRALWSRHEAGYRRAWDAILSHHLVKIEQTHWHTLDRDNPDYVRRASENHLWSWLDHVQAMATLRGVQIKWIPSKLSSRTCSHCGWVAPQRQRGRWFTCAACKLKIVADINAARNIRRR